MDFRSIMSAAKSASVYDTKRFLGCSLPARCTALNVNPGVGVLLMYRISCFRAFQCLFGGVGRYLDSMCRGLYVWASRSGDISEVPNYLLVFVEGVHFELIRVPGWWSNTPSKYGVSFPLHCAMHA